MSTRPKITPLISVRIPTKNRAYLLKERSLASVSQQTYPELEVVVVGDYCTDNTEDVIYATPYRYRARFHNLGPREKEITDPEMRWLTGPVRATNKATELCKGEWIAHLDDDDIWTPDHVEIMYNFAIDYGFDFVSCAYIKKTYGQFQKVSGEEIDGKKVGGCQTWLYRTEIARQFPYDEQCYKKPINRVSDLDVAERIVQSGYKIGYLDEVGAYVLPRPGEDTVGLKAYLK